MRTPGRLVTRHPLPTYFALTFAISWGGFLVWVYDRTESLLVATLMHASLTASTIFVFTPLATG